jgi:hypothetical protein
MNVGVQIGPEGVPGCGVTAPGTEGLGSDVKVEGLAGNSLPWGDGKVNFQSSWRQFIEALGVRSGEVPGTEAEAVSAPSLGKPAPGQALGLSWRTPVLKAGNTMASPREAPDVRTGAAAGRKAAGAGSKAQAHERRKVDRLSTTTSAAAVAEPALGLGVQPVGASTPEIALSRGSLPPTGDSAAMKTLVSEPRYTRHSGLFMPVANEGELAKGSTTGPEHERTGTVSENVPADANGGRLSNGKGTAAFEPEPELERTEASGNLGWQEPRPDLSGALQRGVTGHSTTESAIANAVAVSGHSQPVADATPPAEHHTGLRGARAVEPSPEKTGHGRMAVESAGERRFSAMTAQDAGSPIPVREPAEIADARGRQDGWVDPVRAAGKEMSGMTGEETFARLDAETGPRSIHWVQAGAHHAEAGYLDPALGWVGVRAESIGGGVHAAVLPGSPEAAQVLGSHLGGLNAFLAQEHGPHATATMAAPQDGRYGAGAEQGNSTGGGSGRDDGAGKNGPRAREESDSSLRTAASETRAVDRSVVSDGAVMRRAGTHVSVMA